jgi:membrane protease YdiL (CAAX protease family)
MAYYRKIPLAEFGLQRPSWRTQLLIALSGLPLGLIGFLILHPAPLFAGSDPVIWIANLLVIFICIAFTEEIVFRGVLLHFMTEVSERFALLVSGVLYGILNIGSRSLIYALFMGLIGGVFAFFALRTRSIWGIVVAHFLLVAGMGLFWPLLIRN